MTDDPMVSAPASLNAHLDLLLRALAHAPTQERIEIVYNVKEQLEAAFAAGGAEGLAAALADMPAPNTYAAHYPPPGGDAESVVALEPPKTSIRDGRVREAGKSGQRAEIVTGWRQGCQLVIVIAMLMMSTWLIAKRYFSSARPADRIVVGGPDGYQPFQDDPALPGHWRTVGIARTFDSAATAEGETMSPFHLMSIRVEPRGLAYWHIAGGPTVPTAWTRGLFRVRADGPVSDYRLYTQNGRTYMTLAWKGGVLGGGLDVNYFVLVRTDTPSTSESPNTFPENGEPKN